MKEQLHLDLEKITTIARADLENHGYSVASIGRMAKLYRALQRFCDKLHTKNYTQEIGERFIMERNLKSPHLHRDSKSFNVAAIRRLDCILAGTRWMPLRRPTLDYVSSSFDDVVIKYEGYLYRAGKARPYVRSHTHVIARFLRDVQEHGTLNLKDLSAKCIYYAFQKTSCKQRFRTAVVAFLRYAYKHGLILENLSLIVPTVPRRKVLPTVYSPEEVERLLAIIDRKAVLGKRNYAIILIAARLGLRASDIAGLKFGNIRPAQKKIEIIQKKTNEPLSLPLLDEINDALDDYIHSERPNTAGTNNPNEHIFLNQRGYGAISAATVGNLTHKAFVRSGVSHKGKKSGSHALRSSLATALLAEGNDYFAIQKVLGHKNIQQTKSYARTDVEQLRVCALPPPVPSGNFGVLLGMESEV